MCDVVFRGEEVRVDVEKSRLQDANATGEERYIDSRLPHVHLRSLVMATTWCLSRSPGFLHKASSRVEG